MKIIDRDLCIISINLSFMGQFFQQCFLSFMLVYRYRYKNNAGNWGKNTTDM